MELNDYDIGILGLVLDNLTVNNETLAKELRMIVRKIKNDNRSNELKDLITNVLNEFHNLRKNQIYTNKALERKLYIKLKEL